MHTVNNWINMDKYSKLYDIKQYLKKNFWKLNSGQFIDLILENIGYIYTNFQEVDNLNEYYSHKFELEIGKYFTILMESLSSEESSDFKKANKHLRDSENVRGLILELIRNEKYGNSRADLIRNLGRLKWDKELVIIAEEYSVWSKSHLLSIELVEAVTKRRIKGFSDIFYEFNKTNTNNELNIAIKKYINKQQNYKKHKSEFL